jgi:hypothetical protein
MHYFMIVVQLLLILFDFVFIQFFCSFFMRKIFNSDTGLYSSISILLYVKYGTCHHHHLCKSNKHHTSDCTVSVLV